MDFYDVLERVLGLLQRHKRVTYRALQRQFDLDAAYLEDLKAEIIEARQLAVDEGGKVLVWTGAVDAPAASALPVPPAVPQPVAPQDFPLHDVAAPAQGSASEVQRRQLTVLFCDLVDSTALARQLGPEDYRELVRAYQIACADAIQRFDGYIAQYLGDGLLVYFGYPQAHEDDAQRAVRAGLEILDAMAPLKAWLAADKGLRLAVRLGIHTGLVVVGAMGTGGRQERWPWGTRPILQPASRVWRRPTRRSLVTRPGTWCKGILPVTTWARSPSRGWRRPCGVSGAGDEWGAEPVGRGGPRGLTPLVGRETEVAVLRERWAQARMAWGRWSCSAAKRALASRAWSWP